MIKPYYKLFSNKKKLGEIVKEFENVASSASN